MISFLYIPGPELSSPSGERRGGIGTEKQGFTPPHPDIGELWPTTSQQVIDNQENFGKLWHLTRGHLAPSYSIMKDTRMGLYLTPRKPVSITLANIGPGGPNASLMKLRVHTDQANLAGVQRVLEEKASSLPVPPEMVAGQLRGKRKYYVDLLAPLRVVLGPSADAKVYERRLYDQVVPVLDALANEGVSGVPQTG